MSSLVSRKWCDASAGRISPVITCRSSTSTVYESGNAGVLGLPRKIDGGVEGGRPDAGEHGDAAAFARQVHQANALFGGKGGVFAGGPEQQNAAASN